MDEQERKRRAKLKTQAAILASVTWVEMNRDMVAKLVTEKFAPPSPSYAEAIPNMIVDVLTACVIAMSEAKDEDTFLMPSADESKH